MSMGSWAEKEIEILKAGNKDEECGFDYVGSCCDSALKAFRSLMDDGHSGMSIGITTGILNKLIEGKPLTPIEDTEDIWNETGGYGDEEKGIKHYQCKRMSVLFKDVYPDGRVEYHDVNRTKCVYIDNPDISWHSGDTSRLINELYPITMPYIPSSEPFVVYCEEFLTDESKGDYDTKGMLYLITPKGDKKEINRFYHEFDKHQPMKEISKEEYEKLKDKIINK